jgi:hypothetical protein
VESGDCGDGVAAAGRGAAAAVLGMRVEADCHQAGLEGAAEDRLTACDPCIATPTPRPR